MFKYKPADVSCRNCLEYAKKTGCTAEHCPYLAERIEAGVVGYREAVGETFYVIPALRHRLTYLIAAFSGSVWHDDEHEHRMEIARHYAEYNRQRNTNEYFAALYLLTATRDLHRRTLDCYTKTGIEFDRARRRGISEQDYALLYAAKSIYTGVHAVTPADLSDSTVIETDTFQLIANAMLIVHYGMAATKIKRLEAGDEKEL